MALELDSTLLEILACPICHSNLSVDYDAKELVCNSVSCGLAYPIRGGIPVMLVEEARDTRLPPRRS
ncbi:MAG: Trm112 family protein [Propionibacteriaceae bacterium]|nr:Trm112 family protein [Propionibacteriaceae bacterium]MCL2481821.1 Trm112 family protein [Propionibacteriaceae bacterium]